MNFDYNKNAQEYLATFESGGYLYQVEYYGDGTVDRIILVPKGHKSVCGKAKYDDKLALRLVSIKEVPGMTPLQESVKLWKEKAAKVRAGIGKVPYYKDDAGFMDYSLDDDTVIHLDGTTCPLCIKYTYGQEDKCLGCPVQRQTNRSNCSGSPYIHVRSTISHYEMMGQEVDEDLVNTFDAEVAFLESLEEPDETSNAD